MSKKLVADMTLEELERNRAWWRKYRASDKGKAACHRAKRKDRYGITDDEYEAMRTDQQNICLICRDEFGDRTPHVDHCHDTGRVRGLLCNFCNRGLGLFKDDPERLETAIQYLSQSQPS